MNTKFLLKYKKDILIGLLFIYCHLHSTQVRLNIELHSTDTGVNYGVDILNLDENNIKIAKLVYKYRYLAYMVCTNGYRFIEWKD